VLDGSRSVPPEAWEFVSGDVFRFQPETEAISTALFGRRPGGAASVEPAARHLPNLAPKEWALAGGWIYFCVEHGKLPQDYELSYAFFALGVHALQSGKDVAISNLTMQGYQLDGIYLHNVQGTLQLINISALNKWPQRRSLVSNSEVNLQNCALGVKPIAMLSTITASAT